MECVKIRFAPGAEPLTARNTLERAVRSVNRSGLWRTLYLDFFAFVEEASELPEVPETPTLPDNTENVTLPAHPETLTLPEKTENVTLEESTENVTLPENTELVENVETVPEEIVRTPALVESFFFGVLLSTEISRELLRELALRTESVNLQMSFVPLTLADAEETYREAVETCRGQDIALSQLSAACEHLSRLLSDTGRVREAETLCREALDGYRKLSDKGAVAGASHHLARILYGAGRMEEAEKRYCEALDIYRELSKRNSDHQAPLARTCEDLAACLEERGRPEAAEWFRRTALDLYRKLAERNAAAYAPCVAAACGNLAGLLKASGRIPEAAALYRVALDTYTKLVQDDPAKWEPALGFLYENLAAFESTYSPASGKALLRSAWMLYQKYPDLSAEAERVQAQLRAL